MNEPCSDGRHRVVVIGHGMVASRFLDELEAAAPGHADVTVLGEEPHAPYNRLLLAEVVSGQVDASALALPTPPEGTSVHAGRAAAAIDRQARIVTDAAGGRHPYDTLVLATGASARGPGLAGTLPGEPLPPGVHTLRTLDDCRAILRSARGAARAVVVGGGLLGIEAALGLQARGLAVTVVHAGPHVLDRQLDAGSAEVAAAALGDLGLRVVADSRPSALTFRSTGMLTSVLLADGAELAADLVVVAVGVVPRVELAAAAGLPVGRGVLVGSDLRSPADRRIAAIGDCAEPPEGCSGLLAPGWEQARRLARALGAELGGAEPHPRGPARAEPAPAASDRSAGEVVRLKATDLDIVTLGRPHADGARVVSLSDPVGRRSLRIAVAGSRIVGAVLVGAGRVAADLTAAFEQRLPVPDDPALLLLPGAGALMTPAAPGGPAAVVCTCNRVTRGAIAEACAAGAATASDVARMTRATTGCGGCLGAVNALINTHNDASRPEVFAV